MTTNRSQQERDNRRAAWRWGSFVVGLLSVQVIGGIIAIMLATGDESVAVVPDYHRKALHWDEEVAIRTASTELGWVAQMTPNEQGGGLQIRLRDRNGDFVVIESGSVEIYRHVRAGNIQRLEIPSAASGAFVLSDCFDASGLWQVTLDVCDSDGNRFVDSQELFVEFTPKSGNSQGRAEAT